MANQPKGDIELLFGVSAFSSNKAAGLLGNVPSMRLRFSRQGRSLEFARHISSVHGEEWTKKVISATTETPYISTGDWKTLEQTDKDAMHQLTRFVRICESVEELIEDTSQIDIDTKANSLNISPTVPQKQSISSSSQTASTIANSLASLGLAPRPPKLRTVPRPVTQVDLNPLGHELTIQEDPDDLSRRNERSASNMDYTVNPTWCDEDLELTNGGRAIQTRFIPNVGWCIRYGSRVSQGGRYRMMFLDGVALDIDVDEDWVEFKSGSGETTM